METFIRTYDAIDSQTCRAIINVHKRSKFRLPGQVGDGNVDESQKKSIDTGYTNGPHLQPCIFNALAVVGECLDLYLREFPDANNVDSFRIEEGFNIQQYEPGGGYFVRHFERSSHSTLRRHLVFMVYLNTVTDGGGTAFPYQRMTTEAVAGRVVLWPSDWTHAHYGIPSPSQEKFIMTGWYSYV